MTSDGILEKELRERFGVDSIVSHLDGNVLVTLKPEAFDKLCDDEGYVTMAYLEESLEEQDAASKEAYKDEGYMDALRDIRNLAGPTYSLAEIRNGTGWPRGVRFQEVTS